MHVESGWTRLVDGARSTRSNRNTIIDLSEERWVECAPGLHRSLPFPTDALVRHFFDDRWLVASPAGVSVERTDGSVLKELGPAGAVWIKWRLR